MCVCEDCALVPMAGHLKNDFFEIFALICYHFSRCLFNICLQRCMKLQQVLQLGDAAVAAGDTLLAPMNKVGHSLGSRSTGAAKLQASGRGARPPAWGAAAAEAALPSGLSSRPVPPGRTRVQAQAVGRCRGRSWLGGPPWVRPGPGRWGEERTKVRAALCRPLGCRRDSVGGGGREKNTFPVSRKPGAMGLGVEGAPALRLLPARVWGPGKLLRC